METDILELEKKYWQGMKNHDYETVKNLTSFPCIIAGRNGVLSVNEDQFKKMFESGDGNKIKVLNISDAEVRLLAENTGIIGYLIEFGITDQQNNPVKCACTSTWIKEGDSWFCAMHTETELQKIS